MRDLAQKWTAMPDWHEAVIAVPGLTVRTRSGLEQYLVSGDLVAWSEVSGLADRGVGAFGTAEDDRYTVRLGRDRLLAVSTAPFDIATGWHEEGFGVTATSAGLHVFEIEGPAGAELISRATPVDPGAASASASLVFGGVGVIAYHHQGTLRLHVERGLATYLWTWLKTAARQPALSGQG
ncbi:hypothetical protein CYK37_08350 [Mesorhizobium loti]|nr:hypothetical protein [Mesorhizobium loti]PLP60157.1 hypothetical protein CYK37_08350 [Mesorhizobium loti]